MFKEWKVTKNVREEEWNFIFSRMDERETLGKLSAVKVRGASISEAKLQKQRSKQRQSIYDRHIARKS